MYHHWWKPAIKIFIIIVIVINIIIIIIGRYRELRGQL